MFLYLILTFKDLKNLIKVSLYNKELIGEKLPWLPIAISNTKRKLLNYCHNIKPEFLKAFLDESCYIFNRRYFGEAFFGRLLGASVIYKNQFRYD